jgi:hypothetical protein
MVIAVWQKSVGVCGGGGAWQESASVGAIVGAWQERVGVGVGRIVGAWQERVGVGVGVIVGAWQERVGVGVGVIVGAWQERVGVGVGVRACVRALLPALSHGCDCGCGRTEKGGMRGWQVQGAGGRPGCVCVGARRTPTNVG